MNYSDLPTIWLASASPRRTELLTLAGIRHEVLQVPAPEGEDEPILENESGADYVLRTALEKAQRAVQYVEKSSIVNRPILTADTTVLVDNDILGKAADVAMAKAYLLKMSGRSHEVRTAVVLSWQGQQDHIVSVSEVYFKTLSEAEIDFYCSRNEWQGKAGAYGIQGLAAALFIERINGSYSGIMGLPLFETNALLQKLST